MLLPIGVLNNSEQLSQEWTIVGFVPDVQFENCWESWGILLECDRAPDEHPVSNLMSLFRKRIAGAPMSSRRLARRSRTAAQTSNVRPAALRAFFRSSRAARCSYAATVQPTALST